ncbi:hypothetical protein B566_EDAN006544 [Ephemera danica]|nr:hypothetical protein B566_EDAN006544 [Ephemera danica]
MRGPGARGLRCALCGAIVCRACSRVVRPSARIRLCGSCFNHREIQCPSGEWIYRELKTKFHDVTPSSSSESSLDTNMEVREFIERLTENLVSGSVDDVTVEPLSCHPQYDALCSQFHRPIQDMLCRLSESLQQAIIDHPSRKEANTSESPSEVHVHLKRLVSELRTRAIKLPLLELDSYGNDEEDDDDTKSSPAVIDFSRRTYEDLLATAIINKVVETAQCLLMEQHLRSPGPYEASATATAASGGDSSRFICKCMANVCAGAADINNRHVTASVHVGVDNYDDVKPTQVKHETRSKNTTYDEASDEEGDMQLRQHPESRGRRSEKSMSADMQRFLASLKYSHRVPFPELGADIVEGSVQESLLEETARTTLYLVNSDSHHSSLSSTSWEENWLFQRRRLRLAPLAPRTLKHDEGRVPMLVPNPRTEDSLIRARVGDLDADQLSSDLSDYESYMSKSEDEQDSLEIDRNEGVHLMSKGPPDLIEATNQEMHGATLILAPSNGNGLTDGSEFDQQEGEYLEDYASIGQRSLTSLQDALESQSNRSVTSHVTFDVITEINLSLSLTPENSHVPDILESTQQPQQPKPPVAAPRRLQPAEQSLDHEEEKQETALTAPPRPVGVNKPEMSGAGFVREPEIPELPIPSTPEQPLRVNCSGHTTVDFRQYGRDYYINEFNSAKMENVQEGWRLEVAPEEAGLVSETYLESLSCLRRAASLREQGTQPRANSEEQIGGSLRNDNIEEVTDLLESVLDAAEAAIEVSSVQADAGSSELATDPGDVHAEIDSDVAQVQVNGSSSMHADNGSVSSASSVVEGDESKRPSVRELAKQFGPTATGGDIPPHLRKSSTNKQNNVTVNKKPRRTSKPSDFHTTRDVVIVETSSPSKQPAPVHSLTARNLSKGMRADLRGQPQKMENGTAQFGSEQEKPQPADRHRANLEFWRALEPTAAAPTPAPRQPKK